MVDYNLYPHTKTYAYFRKCLNSISSSHWVEYYGKNFNYKAVVKQLFF